ncbi:DUF1016 N-terminal domain-containing protein [Arthrobacter bambusae]|uniref:DUF1016 N-terminal domain-containing protein n=1 Tax=Arthrobacter bambusae TaxID=1338426 RepID=UPI0027E06231|nr:DUF1016 N-terminal domain-containing protein [Arthrobacter bambusae]
MCHRLWHKRPCPAGAIQGPACGEQRHDRAGGRTILDLQANEVWDNKFLDRLARDLRSEFPHLRGFSRTNVYNMRAFAAAWTGLNQLSRRRLDN